MKGGALMTEPKKTPFYEKHLQLKGSVVDYSGWYLPVQYAGIVTRCCKPGRRPASLMYPIWGR
jgi:glycine cleavage system aminomethyltransferase T